MSFHALRLAPVALACSFLLAACDGTSNTPPAAAPAAAAPATAPATAPTNDAAPHPNMASAPGETNPHAGMDMAPSEPAKPIAGIAKADGPDGHTVSEVFAQRTALSGKTVSVSGQVVKVNHGIMGHNWLHLQDGSGTEAGGDQDLAVTTDGDAQIGDVVTATGTLGIDRDFGAGYTYKAIIESATVTTQDAPAAP